MNPINSIRNSTSLLQVEYQINAVKGKKVEPVSQPANANNQQQKSGYGYGRYKQFLQGQIIDEKI